MVPIIILVVVLGVFVWWFLIVRIVRKIHPFPIPGFLTRLIDNPVRRKLIHDPDKISAKMGIEPGMEVLEIGPGKGSFAAVAARKVGPEGIIHAIDIQPSIIDRLKKKIQSGDLPGNISPRVDDVYELSFPDQSIDVIYAIACLPEIPDKVRALTECERVLKPGGIVSLCEVVLDPDYPLRSTEMKWASAAGLKLKSQHGNFFSYQLNFTK